MLLDQAMQELDELAKLHVKHINVSCQVPF
jgi:hypothetical protein